MGKIFIFFTLFTFKSPTTSQQEINKQIPESEGKHFDSTTEKLRVKDLNKVELQSLGYATFKF